MIQLLSGEHGSRYMRHIKSALSLNLRPSAHIVALKKPQSGWSEMDHKLALAYSALNDEMCDKCGNPVWVCRNTDPNIGFRIETYRCFADAELVKARKKWEDRNSGKNKERLKPGEYEYVRPYTYDKTPLPTREQFFDALAKEREG